MVLGIGSAVSGLASMWQQNKATGAANAANRRQYELSMQQQTESNQMNASRRAGALQQGQRALGETRKGYKKALGAVSAEGVSANRQIASNLRKSQGQTRASVYGRGMGSSSAQMGLQGQQGFNMARGQADVAGRLGSLRASLQEGKGQAMAQGRRGIAQIQQQNAQGQLQDTRATTDVLGAEQTEAAKIDFGAFAPMIDAGVGGIQKMLAKNAGPDLGTPPPQKAFSGQTPPPMSAPSSESPPPMMGGQTLPPMSAPSSESPPPMTAGLGLAGPGPMSMPNPMGSGARANMSKKQQEQMMMKLLADQNRAKGMAANAWMSTMRPY
ncbi:MAG: hypothetical protein OSB57_04205 [Planctomycetota bacterium]|nr:hypothetical protein [Planctomycetota bacterium]